MKVSEMIRLLEKFQEEHGDLECMGTTFDLASVASRPPTLAHKAALKGRESKPRFHCEYTHKDREPGEPVCRMS